MARSSRSLVATLAAMLIACQACGGVAHAHGVTVVRPGQSIQAAVDAAEAGDTIRVFGTHRENVAIQTDDLTLRGVRAVILPPATPAVHDCFDPSAANEAVHGICVIGKVNFKTGDVSRYVAGVTVSGFMIRDFRGSGAVAVAARDTKLERNVLRDNRDAGINVANSIRTQVRDNRASGSRFGVTVSAAHGGRIIANSLRANCAGVAFIGPGGGFRVAANKIQRNSRACPAGGELPAVSGIGVALVGATDNVIVANQIAGNRPTGDSAFSGGVVIVNKATDNAVKANRIRRNDPDLLWDQSGTGNVFSDNRCESSAPAGLCD